MEGKGQPYIIGNMWPRLHGREMVKWGVKMGNGWWICYVARVGDIP